MQILRDHNHKLIDHQAAPEDINLHGKDVSVMLAQREHEREARIVALLPSSIESVERDFDEQKCLTENLRGLKVPFKIEGALDEIYMSPYASEQHCAAVRQAMETFAILVPIEWSHIADAPNP